MYSTHGGHRGDVRSPSFPRWLGAVVVDPGNGNTLAPLHVSTVEWNGLDGSSEREQQRTGVTLVSIPPPPPLEPQPGTSTSTAATAMNMHTQNMPTQNTPVTTTTFEADAAMTSMTLETRAINSREHTVVWEMVKVPYDANDL